MSIIENILEGTKDMFEDIKYQKLDKVDDFIGDMMSKIKININDEKYSENPEEYIFSASDRKEIILMIIQAKKKAIMYIIKKYRPTFLYKSNDVRAAGVLLYKYTKSGPEFLMIKNTSNLNKFYEDFGGKTDQGDKSFIDTVIREAEEESNYEIKKDDIRTLIEDSEPLYFKSAKYILYIIKAPKDYVPNDFGTKEIYEDIPRIVEWVPYSRLTDRKFSKYFLTRRLRYGLFFSRLKYIFDDERII